MVFLPQRPGDIRYSWLFVVASLSLTIHGLVIDDWERCDCHGQAIEICAIILSVLLGIISISSLTSNNKFQAFLWLLVTLTTVGIALTANGRVSPNTAAIVYGIAIGASSILLCCISFVEKLDWRTLSYVSCILITIGTGSLFAVTKDVMLAGWGSFIAYVTLTLPYVGFTWKDTTDKTPIYFVTFFGFVYLCGVLACTFLHHKLTILIFSWLFHLAAWVMWPFIMKTSRHSELPEI